ncbi:neuroepithelial cell-transforming gene 1 protein-like [Engraulis encrasicolus]|uniref:neuroepithelial cell-transforming gene 1 protein-like n=1 Tax=Engraulis encrasicolus TaxID=184585 RepID=UPI002FD36185
MEETTEPQFEIPELNTLPKRRKSKKRNSTVLDTETSPEINNNAKRPPLRRGSSFTFLTPSSQWDFSLKRKRREKDDDTVSLSNFDFKVGHLTIPQASTHARMHSHTLNDFLMNRFKGGVSLVLWDGPLYIGALYLPPLAPQISEQS